MNADVAAFVERMKRERVDAGLSVTIVDADALSVLAAVVANREVVADASAA
jgi:hypothetical protein